MTLTTHGNHIPGSPRHGEIYRERLDCGGIPLCAECLYEADLFVNGEYDDLHRVQEFEARKLYRDRRLGRTRSADPLRLRSGSPSVGGGLQSFSVGCNRCGHDALFHSKGKCLLCVNVYCSGIRDRPMTQRLSIKSLAISGPVDTPSIPLMIPLWKGQNKKGQGIPRWMKKAAKRQSMTGSRSTWSK